MFKRIFHNSQKQHRIHTDKKLKQLIGLKKPLAKLASKNGKSQKKVTKGVSLFSVISPPVPKPFDVELLYVECSRCGAPVIWEPGKTKQLLELANIDPLELDASCILLTDACPICGSQKHYTVQIFRVGQAPLMIYGNA